MSHKNSPGFLESFDTLWLKKYFELKKIAYFQHLIFKTYLKACNFNSSSYKNSIFFEKFEIFSKTKHNNGFKIIRRAFT